jgi:hypothetical protein
MEAHRKHAGDEQGHDNDWRRLANQSFPTRSLLFKRKRQDGLAH